MFCLMIVIIKHSSIYRSQLINARILSSSLGQLRVPSSLEIVLIVQFLWPVHNSDVETSISKDIILCQTIINM